jgi:hypothetical protein
MILSVFNFSSFVLGFDAYYFIFESTLDIRSCCSSTWTHASVTTRNRELKQCVQRFARKWVFLKGGWTQSFKWRSFFRKCMSASQREKLRSRVRGVRSPGPPFFGTEGPGSKVRLFEKGKKGPRSKVRHFKNWKKGPGSKVRFFKKWEKGPRCKVRKFQKPGDL